MTWAGLQAGDVLRRTARTTTRTLPRPRRLNATETLNLAPSLRADTLRGGLLAWDGQLEDDARLVVTVARTAASYGADVRTRARVTGATGTGVELRDELTGETYAVRAGAVVNATGVWAGDLDDQVRLRPSRGTHLVLRGSVLPHTRVAVMVPIPGTVARFAMVLPQPDGTHLRRPHRRAGHRSRCPTCRRRARRRSTSCSAWSRPPSPPRRRAPTWSAPSPGCARCSRSRHRHHRRPVAPARDPHLDDRRHDRRRRQAHDLPPDGRRTPSTRSSPPAG